MDRRVNLGQDVNTRVKSSAVFTARSMDNSSRWFIVPFRSIKEVRRQSLNKFNRRTFFKNPFSIKCWTLLNNFDESFLLSVTSKDLKWIASLFNSIFLRSCLVTWFRYGRGSREMVRNQFCNPLHQFFVPLVYFYRCEYFPVLAKPPQITRWNDFPSTRTWSGTAKCRRLALTNSFFSIARIAQF